MNEDENKNQDDLSEINRYTEENNIGISNQNEFLKKTNFLNSNPYNPNYSKIQRKTMLQYMVKRNNDLKGTYKPQLKEILPKYKDIHPDFKNDSSLAHRELLNDEMIKKEDQYSDEKFQKSQYLKTKFIDSLSEAVVQNNQNPESINKDSNQINNEFSFYDLQQINSTDTNFRNNSNEQSEEKDGYDKFDRESYQSESIQNQGFRRDFYAPKQRSRNKIFSKRRLSPEEQRPLLPPRSDFRNNLRFPSNDSPFQEKFNQNKYYYDDESIEMKYNSIYDQRAKHSNYGSNHVKNIENVRVNPYEYQSINGYSNQENEFLSRNPDFMVPIRENHNKNSLIVSDTNSLIEEHGYEMVKDLRSIRDKAKNDVLQEMLDGEWHDEKKLIRIAKKSRYLGTVSFGMMMYSLKDSICHDFLIKKIMNDGKNYYKIHDNFVGLARAAFSSHK